MATADAAPPVTVSAPARALAVALLAAGLAVSGIAMLSTLSTFGLPDSYELTPLGDIGAFIFATTLLALGFVLRARRPANVIGWLFLVFGVCAAYSHLMWAAMQTGYLPGGDRGLGATAAWFGSVGSILTWTYLFASIVIRFPDGQPDTRGEARLLRWLPAFCVVAAATAALRPGPLLIYPAFDNPVPTPQGLRDVLSLASNLGILGVLVPLVVSARAIVRRYRVATSVARLQLRWFAFGATISLTATAVFLVFGVLIAPDNKFVREGTYALFVASLAGLPIAVFRAITSHHLYEIDRIIGKAFAYGALTAILAGLYSASVRLFNWIFVSVTGQESEAALVLTTLVLATTFTPIKSWLEHIAAKRFKFDQGADGADGAGEATDAQAAAAAPFTPAQLDAIDARVEAAVRRALAHPPGRPRRR